MNTETLQQRAERLADAMPPAFINRNPASILILIKEVERGIALSQGALDYLERLEQQAADAPEA